MTRTVQVSKLPGSGQSGGSGRYSFPALPDSFGGFDIPQAAPQTPHADVFRTIHRRLRGRYLLASVLGVICAAAGGAAGYFSQRPMFKCETSIRVVMMEMTVLGQDHEYQNRINQFNTIISTQASFLQSARVISKAMESEAWSALGRPRTNEVEQQFRDSLKIIPQRDSPELISVSFQDPNPRAAKAGLESVVLAYDDIYVKAENAGVDQSAMRLLEEEQKTFTAELKGYEAEIAAATKDLPTSNAAMFQESIVSQLFRLDEIIADLTVRITNAGGSVQAVAGGTGAAGDGGKSTSPGSSRAATPRLMTAYEIYSAGDEEMMGLLNKRRALDEKLDSVRANGATEEHMDVKRIKKLIETSDQKIKDYVNTWNADGGFGKDPQVVGTTRPETLEQMSTRLQRLEEQHKKWNEEAKSYKQLALLVADKRDLIRHKRERLAEVETALSGFRMKLRARQEQPLVQIDRDIPTPRAPAFDRRKKIGAIGFVMGGMLPFGLFMLYGVLDRRFRYSDQAGEQSSGLPLLGILPELPSNLSDPEEAAAAAHCVHQMRTMLQISGGSRKVYAITSATSGDGKTCLTLSLGLSFAASGSKTLLVDFDLVGQGLSSKLKIRPEHGMASSLETGQPGDSIVATKIDRLFLLPAGRHDEEFVSHLSRPMVQQAIDAVRDDYDVIIIDTGPVLGSLEANFVTSQAEGVVLVVGRNQHRSLVQRAEQHLITLGARVIGQVFNRALSTDFKSSMSSASMRSTRSTPGKPVTAIQIAKADDSLLELDPVSRTVALDIRR